MNREYAILVMIDIVDSTKYFEKVGDKKASEVMRLYDRIFRGLLIKYSGLEIDKTDGALLLFESIRDAVYYVNEYHRLVENHIGLYSRVGIHAGYVMMHSNLPVFVSRGAKPIEIEGIQKAVCARIMSIAEAGQTVLSEKAGEIALGIKRDIGKWKLKGVKKPMQLYLLSDDKNRLYMPKNKDKCKRVSRPKLTPEQKIIRYFNVFVLPFFILWILHVQLAVLICLGYEFLKPFYYCVDYIVKWLHSIFYYTVP